MTAEELTEDALARLVNVLRGRDGLGDLNQLDTDTVAEALRRKLVKVVARTDGQNLQLTAKGRRS